MESPFKLALKPPESLLDIQYPPRSYRKGWTRQDLLSVLPESGITALDVGSGPAPLRLRSQDRVTTVDMSAANHPDVVTDVTKHWPFRESEFDLVYAAHSVEHFYARDRDRLMCSFHQSLRPGGLLFIRVPHRTGFQATGWEHQTVYGLHGAVGLCHGQNPYLPMFRAVSSACVMSINFSESRNILEDLMERCLNLSWGLTERWLGFIVGGIPEVQFLLQKLSPEVEARFRTVPMETSHLTCFGETKCI